MNGKEQLIEILTQRYKRYDGVFRRNAFDSEPRYQYYSFNEISTLDDADIDRIIHAYQSKTSEPMSINNRLLLLDCVYETIADNKRYQELFDKLIDIYKIELDDKLTKPTTRYDDFNFVETSELHQAPYTTLPEYSLVLADMCTRYINESQKSYTDNSILPSNKVESRISTYEAIKSDFAKFNQQMPEVQEQIVSENKTSGLSQPNFNGLSDDVKRKIIEQIQLRGQGDVIISGIDNIYQEGNYIVVDAKQSNGRFIGAEFTIDDFNKIINQPLQPVGEHQQQKVNQESNISHNDFDKDLIMLIEAKNSNLGKVSEILSVTGYPDSTYEVRFEDGATHQITITQDEKNFIKNHPPVQQPVQPVLEHSQQQVSQEESEKILQDQQKQMKDQVINQIMGAMNKSGELSFGDISMGERMSIMQNIQNELNAKSMDELQMLLSTYQEQNIQEESMHSGMHR